MATRTRIAIVGGGITGASVAYQLSTKCGNAAEITLFDQGDAHMRVARRESIGAHAW